MLEDFNSKDELTFKDLSQEEKEQRGILGRLYGPCASIITATRNGRKYSNELWERVFNDPITKELLAKGGIPGEMDHPTDRSETCSEKIAIMMPETPKKDKDGHLIGYWDIIDTPCGRIAYALAKYGFKLGISSRGEGDVVEDYDSGESVVEPSTYHFNAFDLVLIPACEDARLTMVESLQNGKTFKQAINESLKNATAGDKKIMLETLSKLNIKYNPEKVIDKNDLVANNAGTTVIKELQESLLAQRKLETKITELQEKLSVCYAKEAKYEEDLSKYRLAINNLGKSVNGQKALQAKLASLEEQLKDKDLQIEREQSRIKSISEKHNGSIYRERQLTENVSRKADEVSKANSKIRELTESIDTLRQEYTDKNEKLQESLAETKKNLSIKSAEYNNKLANCNKLVEQYRTTAKTAVSKYVSCKATMLGVSSEEIFNKLPENYSFNDIDSVCESLSDYKLSISNLPFELKKDTKVTIKESKETILPKMTDDTVDDSLLRLAKLK